jgi:hypothetical protein
MPPGKTDLLCVCGSALQVVFNSFTTREVKLWEVLLEVKKIYFAIEKLANQIELLSPFKTTY